VLLKKITYVAIISFGWISNIFCYKKRPTSKKKRVFISFAVEDKIYRDLLKNQARKEKSPFDYIDMSVKKPWKQSEWEDKCRTKIKKCNGVIVLITHNTYNSEGVKHEIKCANEAKIPIIGMYVKKNEKGIPPIELKGKPIIEWTWDNLNKYLK
jgi:hypothetical protein